MTHSNNIASEKTVRQKPGLAVLVTIIEQRIHRTRKHLRAITKVEAVFAQIRTPLPFIPLKNYLTAQCSYTL